MWQLRIVRFDRVHNFCNYEYTKYTTPNAQTRDEKDFRKERGYVSAGARKQSLSDVDLWPRNPPVSGSESSGHCEVWIYTRGISENEDHADPAEGPGPPFTRRTQKVSHGLKTHRRMAAPFERRKRDWRGNYSVSIIFRWPGRNPCASAGHHRTQTGTGSITQACCGGRTKPHCKRDSRHSGTGVYGHTDSVGGSRGCARNKHDQSKFAYSPRAIARA